MRWKLDRLREWVRETLGGEGGGQDSQPRPKVCYDCGLLVGAADTVCPNCGANQSKASLGGLKRVANSLVPAENPATYILLLANLLFMIVTILISQKSGAEPFSVDNRVLYLLGAKWTSAIFGLNEYWRLVMPILLHGGLMHFGFNSFVLWQIGPQVEELFGSQRFLFLYLVTGVAGFVASAFWSPYSLSVGASGSLFGLIGILLAYISQKKGFREEYRASLIRWVFFMLILGLIIPGIDNAAHIGGLVAGLALGRLIGDRPPRNPTEKFRVDLMGWGSAAVFLLSIIMVLLTLPSDLSP